MGLYAIGKRKKKYINIKAGLGPGGEKKESPQQWSFANETKALDKPISGWSLGLGDKCQEEKMCIYKREGLRTGWEKGKDGKSSHGKLVMNRLSGWSLGLGDKYQEEKMYIYIREGLRTGWEKG